MRRYGLIGDPLGHSFSGKYFNDKFSRESINAVYENLHGLKPDGLRDYLDQNCDVAGLNVTIPYKKAVVAHMDELDDEARATGAVNVIGVRRHKEKLILRGCNTDVYGFMESLGSFLKGYKPGGALVLGTGGASLAVIRALEKLAINYLSVSRSASKGDIVYSEIDRRRLNNYPLIINTTPLGMYPDVNTCPPVPYEMLEKGALLFDLVYNPGETMFMKKGREKGCRVTNGLAMLHKQAEKSWDIWTEERL